MSLEIDFIPFATGVGANVESQADYLSDPLLPIGNQPGIALSATNNKALRQGTSVASALANFVANVTNTNVLDNGVAAQLIAQMTASLTQLAPLYRAYTSAGGATYNMSYIFFIVSGNATAAATYTNNGVTYTVSATVAAGLQVTMTGNGAPLTSGTLTKASGTGDATLTFYAVRAPLYLIVDAIGGGGGGAGSGTAGAGGGASNGSAGGNTTLGSTLIAASGGNPGGFSSSAPVGGAVSTGAGIIPLIAVVGGYGMGTTYGLIDTAGPSGACSSRGGAGTSSQGAAGNNAAANSGSGGGGGGAGSTANSYLGSSGASGGFIRALILNSSVAWASTFAINVGSAGVGGTLGTNGFAGGNGGTGGLYMVEYFQ